MGMRTIIESIPIHVIDLIEKLRRQLCDLQFSRRHRVRPEDFTRERQLSLPRSTEMLEEFGAVEVRNHLGATGTTYAEGRMSVLYDLLNRVGLDGRLESSRVGEVELAIEQLRQARLGDVLVNDRGFTGYAYLAWHHRLGLDYVARCSSGSFAAAQELFRMNRAGRSKTVRLLAPADQRAELS